MKKKRITDEVILERIRQLPCIACVDLSGGRLLDELHTSKFRSHPHHIRSRGSGGDDVVFNLIPLCFDHHTEVHQKGLISFAKRYFSAELWLVSMGWHFNKELEFWEYPALPEENECGAV